MTEILKVVLCGTNRATLAAAFSRHGRAWPLLTLADFADVLPAVRETHADVVIVVQARADDALLDLVAALRRHSLDLVVVLQLDRASCTFGAQAVLRGADAVHELAEGNDDLLIAELPALVRTRRSTGSSSSRERDFIHFTLDRAADAALWIHESGAICYVNEAASRSLGYDSGELLERSIFDIAPSLDAELWSRHWRRLKKQGSFRFEFTHRRRNGEQFPVEVTVNHVVFDGREYNCTFARDISRRKALEQRLLQAEKLEAIGRLAGGVAHDFNNLLTVILGQADLMILEDTLDSQARSSLEEIALAARHAANLTSQLLAFGRRQPRRALRIDPAAVIRALRPALDRLVASPCRLDFALAENLPSLLADPGQLEQILLNLTINARDAMPQGGLINLTVQARELDHDRARDLELAPGLFVELLVEDQGPGVDPLTRHRIFEPFFSTKVGGTGLGLSTVYGIVKQNGGAIRVESAEGSGARFVVYLPAHMEAATSGRPTEAMQDEIS